MFRVWTRERRSFTVGLTGAVSPRHLSSSCRGTSTQFSNSARHSLGHNPTGIAIWEGTPGENTNGKPPRRPPLTSHLAPRFKNDHSIPLWISIPASVSAVCAAATEALEQSLAVISWSPGDLQASSAIQTDGCLSGRLDFFSWTEVPTTTIPESLHRVTTNWDIKSGRQLGFPYFARRKPPRRSSP